MSDKVTEESMFMGFAFIVGILLIVLVTNWSSIYPYMISFLFSKPHLENQIIASQSTLSFVCAVNSVATGKLWSSEGGYQCPYLGPEAQGTGMAAATEDTNPFESPEETESTEAFDNLGDPIDGLDIKCKKVMGVECECIYIDSEGNEVTLMATEEEPYIIRANKKRDALATCKLRAQSIVKSTTFSDVQNCKDAEIVKDCTVMNFELPQEVSQAEEWIFTWGDPEHIIYFEGFPQGEDDAWNKMVTAKDIFFIFSMEIGFEATTMGIGKLFKAVKKPVMESVESLSKKSRIFNSFKNSIDDMFTSNSGGKVKKVTSFLFYVPRKVLQAARIGGEFVGSRTTKAFARAAFKLHTWMKEYSEKYLGRVLSRSVVEAMDDELLEGVAKTAIKDADDELLEGIAKKYAVKKALTGVDLEEEFTDFLIRAGATSGMDAGEKAVVRELADTAAKVLNQQDKSFLVKLAGGVAGSPVGRTITYESIEKAATEVGKKAGGRTGAMVPFLWLAHLYDSKNEKYIPWGGSIVYKAPFQQTTPVPLAEKEFVYDTTIVVYKKGATIKKFYMASPCKADLHIRKDVCLVKDWKYYVEDGSREYKTFGGFGVVWEGIDFWDKENACPINGEFASDCKVPCIVIDDISRDRQTSPNFCVSRTPPGASVLYGVSWVLSIGLSSLFGPVGGLIAAPVSAISSAMMLYGEKWP